LAELVARLFALPPTVNHDMALPNSEVCASSGEPIKDRSEVGVPPGLVSSALRNLYSQWLRLTYPFASIGSKVSIHYTFPIRRKAAHRIKLGNFVTIEKDANLDVSLPPEQEGEPVIVIDDNCIIHRCSQIDARNHIHLERDVVVTQGVLIIDHGRANEDIRIPIEERSGAKAGRIRIGQGSWIGHRAAIICPQGELVLGRNCVVAANAVVTESAPPYSVLSGNPARVVRQFNPAKQIWVMGSGRSAETKLVK
jgi:acetyltransferase-like isoleucine patch superfamily enzyme